MSFVIPLIFTPWSRHRCLSAGTGSEKKGEVGCERDSTGFVETLVHCEQDETEAVGSRPMEALPKPSLEVHGMVTEMRICATVEIRFLDLIQHGC